MDWDPSPRGNLTSDFTHTCSVGRWEWEGWGARLGVGGDFNRLPTLSSAVQLYVFLSLSVFYNP